MFNSSILLYGEMAIINTEADRVEWQQQNESKETKLNWKCEKLELPSQNDYHHLHLTNP